MTNPIYQDFDDENKNEKSEVDQDQLKQNSGHYKNYFHENISSINL